MIRVPSAESGGPLLPNTSSADIEAALRAQLADDLVLLDRFMAAHPTPTPEETHRG